MGTSRRDAVHAIGAIVSQESCEILRDVRPFDDDAYVEALQDLARNARRRGSRGRQMMKEAVACRLREEAQARYLGSSRHRGSVPSPATA